MQVETSKQPYGTSITRIWLNFPARGEGTKKGRPVSQASYPRLAGGFIHPTGGGRSCHGADFSGSPASFPFLQPVRPPMCAHIRTCRAYRQASSTRKGRPVLPRRPATLEALPMNRPLSPRSISHAGHTPSSRHAPRRDTFTARPVLVMSSPFHASTALWRVPAGEEATRSDMSRFTPFWVIWPLPGRRGGVLS